MPSGEPPGTRESAGPALTRHQAVMVAKVPSKNSITQEVITELLFVDQPVLSRTISALEGLAAEDLGKLDPDPAATPKGARSSRRCRPERTAQVPSITERSRAISVSTAGSAPARCRRRARYSVFSGATSGCTGSTSRPSARYGAAR